MKRNISNKIALTACLLVLAGCSAHKQLVANKPATPTPAIKAADSKLAAIKAHQLVFNTFSAKASTKLEIDNSSNDVTLNMRIEHNKRIWVSITAVLGIEVARALITPDSIKIINKLQGVYVKQPFSYVYKYASSQVSYNMLEAIFTGNAIPEALNDTAAQLQPNNDGVDMTGNLQDLTYKLIFGPELKETQFNLSSADNDQSLAVTNSNFITQGTQLIPSLIDLRSVSHNKKVHANLHYTRVDLDQTLTYPFNIPENYTSATQN